MDWVEDDPSKGRYDVIIFLSRSREDSVERDKLEQHCNSLKDTYRNEHTIKPALRRHPTQLPQHLQVQLTLADPVRPPARPELPRLLIRPEKFPYFA